MEDNQANTSEFCVNGCGFYGNTIYNHMCSKCYKEANNKSGQSAEKSIEPSMPAAASTTTQASSTDITLTDVQQSVASIPLSEKGQDLSQPALAVTSAATSVQTPTNAIAPPTARPVQSTKARCFLCRAKIPLAKQTINKCRCEYVYCDIHKVPDKHDCDFDFAKMGKDILAKNNPKLNDVHKGGRSFNRID